VARQQGLPVVVVQHELPQGAPVFAMGSESWSLHPEIEKRLSPSWKRVTKEKGSVFADHLHETLLVLLHSNLAAVATTDAWTAAVTAGEALPKSDLGTSAMQGRAAFGPDPAGPGILACPAWGTRTEVRSRTTPGLTGRCGLVSVDG
jgi:hypothetical protein